MVKKAKIEPSLVGKKGQNRTVPKWSLEERYGKTYRRETETSDGAGDV